MHEGAGKEAYAGLSHLIVDVLPRMRYVTLLDLTQVRRNSCNQMLETNVKKRLTSTALFVSAFVVFTFLNGVESVDASCGDYLLHAQSGVNAIFSNKVSSSIPVPVCESCNCRSAPTQPPIESSRVLLIQRHPLAFLPTPIHLSSLAKRFFELINEDLPASVTLEVLTPPPLLVV